MDGGEMKYSGFTGEMRKRADRLWEAILTHPFVKGIGDGTLSGDRFEFYLKQDYAYLIGFSRVLALASAKAHDLPDMSQFAVLLNGTLTMEMELHRRVCADYGITAEQLEKTEPGLITIAYTRMLIASCYEGGMGDVLSVLMPCAAGYVEIAENLRAAGLPEQKHYRDWIETYTSPEMKEIIDWLIGRMNHYAEGVPAESRQRWYKLYLTSARFELLFFDMGWNKNEWPDVVPV